MANITEIIGLLKKIKDNVVDAGRAAVHGKDAARSMRIKELKLRRNGLETKLRLIKAQQKKPKETKAPKEEE